MSRKACTLFLLFLLVGRIAAQPRDPACRELIELTTVRQADSVSEQGRSSLTIVSLNLDREENPERVLSELLKMDKVQRADVFLLQQVGPVREGGIFVPSFLSEQMGLHLLAVPTDDNDELALPGLANLSRYPFIDSEVVHLKRFDLRFNDRCRIALGFTVKTPFGPVRIFNLHLDTRINQEERLEQLEPVLEMAETFTGPAVIGGDFNTANIRWIRRFWPVPGVHDQPEAVLEALKYRGFYTPFESGPPTFKWLFFSFQLDWIFLSDLKTEANGVEEIEFSDHRLLWVMVEG